MQKQIPMGSKISKAETNGVGARKLTSWIDRFVEATAPLDAPQLYRKWCAISTIGATLEQKVWVVSGSRPLYPNLYVLICGHPGVGKTRSIREARAYARELPEFHLAPVSLTFASLVDALLGAKRMLVRLPDPPLEYNSMYIAADELGAFVHKYDDEMIAGLSTFYDPDPYSQNRRTKDLQIKIKSPQLNILAGATPEFLLRFMPDSAWGQGFTSRLIMIFSDERIIGDDFATKTSTHCPNLAHDLAIINTLYGGCEVTQDYRDAVNNWRQLGEPDVPSHPKLVHYVTRRRAHLYKLSVISAVDRSNALILTKADFNRALGWMLEAEAYMPEIFKAGATGADGIAMEEIVHFVRVADKGQGVSESRVTRFAAERIPAHSVLRVIDIMERSGQLAVVKIDKQNMRTFRLPKPTVAGPSTDLE